MRCVGTASLSLGVMTCFGALAGCATSSGDRVQEFADGTYSIGIRSVGREDQEKVLTETIRKAGEYCHAKGQKLKSVPNPGGSDFLFRCVAGDEPSPAATPQE